MFRVQVGSGTRSHTPTSFDMPSTFLSLGPASLIADYDGGSNYMYMGVLSREFRAQWPLPTSTSMGSVITSTARLAELPPGEIQTQCLVHGLAWALNRKLWAQVEWVVHRLPATCRLYSDNLTARILNTGSVAAMRYAILETDSKTARPMFRVAAVEAVNRGRTDAAQYLCTRFTDSRILRAVAVAASTTGNLEMMMWCANTMHTFPTDAIRVLVYNGNVDALKWLQSARENSFDSDQLVLYAALGGHLPAVDWVLNNTGARYDEKEVCLMVGAKGLLHVLRHLILSRGFAFNRSDCIRFAKKKSEVERWLLTSCF